MAILDRPTAADARSIRRTAPDRAGRARRWARNLPILLMCAVATLCVGYGIGTLAQFDDDWRSTAPTLVATTHVPAAEGSPLAQSIAEVLAMSASPVRAVSCPEGARVGDVPQQVCSARGVGGMVSIVASSSAGLLRVDVYAMT